MEEPRKIEYVTVEQYRSLTQKPLTTVDGKTFLLHTPDSEVIFRNMDDLQKFTKAKHEGNLNKDNMTALVTFFKEIIPAIVVLPKVTADGGPDSLAVNELKFGDQILLVTEGMKLAGLDETTLKKVSDFQAPQAAEQ